MKCMSSPTVRFVPTVVELPPPPSSRDWRHELTYALPVPDAHRALLRLAAGQRCHHRLFPPFFFFFCVLFFCLFLTSLLQYNCFTMVCQFLLYNKVNQLYIHICPHISSLLLLPPTLPSHPSRWSQSTELISLCYAAASH